MKVAVPIYHDRIAPHFGTAPDLILLLVEKRRVIALLEFHLAGQSPAERRRRLIALGAEWLLCGAIEEPVRSQLERRGIRVTADLKGPYAEVLGQVVGISTDRLGRCGVAPG